MILFCDPLVKYRQNQNQTPLKSQALSQGFALCILYRKIDQTLVDSLQGLLNFERVGLDCRVITTEYKTRVHWIHTEHLFCNTLVRVIYSVVSGQYSYTIFTSITYSEVFVIFSYWFAEHVPLTSSCSLITEKNTIVWCFVFRTNRKPICSFYFNYIFFFFSNTGCIQGSVLFLNVTSMNSRIIPFSTFTSDVSFASGFSFSTRLFCFCTLVITNSFHSSKGHWFPAVSNCRQCVNLQRLFSASQWEMMK